MNRREIFVSKWNDRHETLDRSETIDMKLWVEVKGSKQTFYSMWIGRSEKSIEVNRPKVIGMEEKYIEVNDRTDFSIEVKIPNMIFSRSAWIEGDF